MERMMERIICDRVKELDGEGVARLSQRVSTEEAQKRSGEIGRRGDPTILFNNYLWPQQSDPTQTRRDNWSHRTYSGDRWVDFRDSKRIRKERKVVCQSGYEFHSAYGCIHHCDYCHLGNTLMIGLNLEELREHLDDLIDRVPWQDLFKFDNQTDNLCFEPEYGASKIFVKYFAEKKGKYLMLYTKSDNVDHLLDLDHRGKTVVCWTLTCDKAARLYEEGAPTMENRIEAAHKCQEAGYTVRFRFSPIIPIKNWRSENQKMMKSLLSRVDPDIICLQMLTHMDATKLRRTMDLSHLDEEMLSTLDERSIGNGGGPFPLRIREEVYRFFLDKIRELSPGTTVVTCLEREEIWQRLGKRMGMEPGSYACCCGPNSTPDNPLLKRD